MPTQGFTVRVGGVEADIERVEVQGSSVSLDLEDDDFVEFGETVTVAYSPPTAGKLQDALGNTVSAIPANELTVRNDVPDPNETDPPEPVAATVIADGSLVRVVFNEPLFFSELPPGAVAGLGETAKTKDSITWSWMAPSEIDQVAGAATWYEWRIRRVGGFWGVRRRIAATTIKVTGLSAETSYEIEVRAGQMTWDLDRRPWIVRGRALSQSCSGLPRSGSQTARSIGYLALRVVLRCPANTSPMARTMCSTDSGSATDRWRILASSGRSANQSFSPLSKLRRWHLWSQRTIYRFPFPGPITPGTVCALPRPARAAIYSSRRPQCGLPLQISLGPMPSSHQNRRRPRRSRYDPNPKRPRRARL